jgi:hypothetical protein
MTMQIMLSGLAYGVSRSRPQKLLGDRRRKRQSIQIFGEVVVELHKIISSSETYSTISQFAANKSAQKTPCVAPLSLTRQRFTSLDISTDKFVNLSQNIANMKGTDNVNAWCALTHQPY